MRRVARGRAATIALVAALGCATSPAAAHAVPPSRVTIVSLFDPIVYGEAAYVNGQLLDAAQDGQAGEPVTLQAAPYPFGTWTDVATATTDFRGYYSFRTRPSLAMQYQTVAQGVASDKTVTVTVAPRIALKAVPVGRTSIRFSGSVGPALPGQRVAVQRRSEGGGWTTIATLQLRGGRTFQGRIRAHSEVALRAFFATDGAHLDGFSPVATALPAVAKRKSKREADHGTGGQAAASCRAPRIAKIAFVPARPTARRGATLHVTASLRGGRVYALDVRWGDGDMRDHLTLAPSKRKRVVKFELDHAYAQPGSYRLRVRAYGLSHGCKRASRISRPTVVVGPGMGPQP